MSLRRKAAVFAATSSVLMASAGCATAEPPVEAPAEAPAAQPYDGRVLSPAKLSLADIPAEPISPLVSRQVVHGTQTTLSRWELKAGAVVPLHHHANEQMSWIISGKAQVFSGGVTYVLEAGDIMVFPPNVEHEFTVLEDTVAVDIFSPARQDWIDAAVAAQK